MKNIPFFRQMTDKFYEQNGVPLYSLEKGLLEHYENVPLMNAGCVEEMETYDEMMGTKNYFNKF